MKSRGKTERPAGTGPDFCRWILHFPGLWGLQTPPAVRLQQLSELSPTFRSPSACLQGCQAEPPGLPAPQPAQPCRVDPPQTGLGFEVASPAYPDGVYGLLPKYNSGHICFLAYSEIYSYIPGEILRIAAPFYELNQCIQL